MWILSISYCNSILESTQNNALRFFLGVSRNYPIATIHLETCPCCFVFDIIVIEVTYQFSN